jgi:hypothetical protein
LKIDGCFLIYLDLLGEVLNAGGNLIVIGELILDVFEQK